ncbi:MAG TPA: DUF2793 domain-containing protein, partial [Rhizomicrobium sp.]|nr:DUF2793 domain-containing protein [Rhizomicrobium sp.]
MTDTTPRTGAPLLAAAQAQKHVTHNEALYQFDAFLCARFLDRTLTAPPSSPADGDTYLVHATATGAWTGQDAKIAYCADGDWRFYAPFGGLVAYVADESKFIVYTGSAWVDYASLLPLQNVPLIGVNTTAAAPNLLSVESNAILFTDVPTGSGGTGDVRATLSKQASGNTASFLFQDNFSGRAEVGLAGDDNFHFKVSPDGSAWHDAIVLTASSGLATIASAAVTSADINGGTVDATAIGATTPSSGAFTTLTASGAATLSPASANVTLSPTGAGTVTIAPATAGAINNVAVGAVTPSSGAFTTLGASAAVTLSPANAAVTLSPTGAGTVTIAPATVGAINNVAIGQTMAANGKFSTLNASNTVTLSPSGHPVTIAPTGSGTVTIAPATAGTMDNMALGGATPAAGTFTGVTAPGVTTGSTSDLALSTSGGTQFAAGHVASAVNNLKASGSATGAGIATLAAAGADSNIDIVLTPKGAGAVRLATVA